MRHKSSSPEARERNRKYACLIGAAAIVLVLWIVSAAAWGHGLRGIPGLEQICSAVAAADFLLLIAVIALMPLLTIFYSKRLESLSVVQQNEMFEKGKQNARDAAQSAHGDPSAAGAKLRTTAALAKIYCVFLTCASLIGIAVAPAAPVGEGIILPSAFLIGILNRILLFVTVRYDWSDYADPAQAPLVHAAARRAADACGIRSEIRILFTPNCEAGIARVGNGKNVICSLILGTRLLDILDEEELYGVLLHEFTHVSPQAIASPIANFPCALVMYSDDSAQSWTDFLGSYIFSYFALKLSFESFEYTMSASEFIERLADRGILAHGNPKKYASAITKIVMCDRFDLVSNLYEMPADLPFAGESFPTDFSRSTLDGFRTAFSERRDRWMESFRVEIQPKNATHPIVRDRLAAIGIGIDDITLTLPPRTGSPYADEVAAIVRGMDKKIYDANNDNMYAYNREQLFLKPTETVRKFEEGGRVCPPEEYRDLLDAYNSIGRGADGEAFCRTVLADDSVTDTEKAYLYFWLGLRLLARDEREGLAMTYRAAELNSNAVNAAIDAIGAYTTRNGLHEDYAEYRRRAMEWEQHDRDVVSERIALRPYDRLRAENFSEEKLSGLLNAMLDAADGHLRAIYLVHKDISDAPDGYASQFVIEFTDNTNDLEKERIYDKIFNILDTLPEDWYYALLVYSKDLAPALAKVKGAMVWSRDCGAPPHRPA